ncbi:tetratricopeptide repeat protein [Frankia sp. CH37]|nr:tetratricopeptide repeat protein [Parafrankia sp. CH37]
MPPRVADHFRHRRAADELGRPVADGVAGELCQVLSGMGGVGKTQLAANHAHQLWSAGAVDVLIWVTAVSREQIQVAYANAATRIIGADPADPALAAERLLEWLATTDVRWLIVIDDLADPADLSGLWPPRQRHGRVLVTTRRQDAALVGPGRRRVDVGLFTSDEAAGYLAAVLVAHGRSDDPDQIAGVAADLGCLPLAVAQAAAYIVDSPHLDCAAYRRRLADRASTLADLAPHARPDEQRDAVHAAWSLSIDRADRCRPIGLARPMLELAAVLDPNGIPEAVLTSPPALAYLAAHRAQPADGGNLAGSGDQRPGDGEPDSVAASSRKRSPVTADDARDALAVLRLLSLADYAPGDGERTLRVHALVQRAVREPLRPQRAFLLARFAADSVLAAWPTVDRPGVLTQALLANTAALRSTSGDHLHRPEPHDVLFHAGNCMGNIGLLSTAIDHYQQLCRQIRTHLGPDHPLGMNARNNLAHWQGRSGDSAGAAASNAELLADQVRVLGPDHPDTLPTRNNLAYWRGQAGDLAGAVAAFGELLTDVTRILGPDDRLTLATRNNLAYWHGRAGDPAGAVAASEQLLADRLRVLGPDHPDTLLIRNDLASWRGQAGDATGAAAALGELLADRLRVLGPDHPDTLVTRNELALWRGAAGDPAGSVEAFRELLADQTRVLGPDHPETLTTRHNLASGLGVAGDPSRAVDAFGELLADRLRVLGPDHPDTLLNRHNLAYWRGQAGDRSGAVEALVQLHSDQLRVLGPDHPHLHVTLNELLCCPEDPTQGMRAFEAVLTEQQRVLGAGHPLTRGTEHNLAGWRQHAEGAAGSGAGRR